MMAGGGAFIGLLVWAYDYNFFLNAGGPATPISRAILRMSHLQDASFPIPVVWPMLILFALGTTIGCITGGFFIHWNRSGFHGEGPVDETSESRGTDSPK